MEIRGLCQDCAVYGPGKWVDNAESDWLITAPIPAIKPLKFPARLDKSQERRPSPYTFVDG